MPHRRYRRVGAYACAALVSVGACSAVRPATAPLSENARVIEVRFASPRTLQARTRAGAPLTLHRVLELRGRVLEAAADTLVLATTAVRSFELWEALSPPVVVTLRTSDRELRVGERYISADRTTQAVLLLPPLIGFVLLYVMCEVRRCLT
jgi:hypothetical protein